jgi:biopolymer transport protein ExbD
MEEKSFDYMNVIPLVDVMLVLLTIVLMASTFVAQGTIPVQLPKASSQQQDRASLKAVTITIDKSGAVYLESAPITPACLAERLKTLSRETPVMIKVDRTITVQLCVDVLDLLTAAGFKKVALQTERGANVLSY